MRQQPAPSDSLMAAAVSHGHACPTWDSLRPAT